MLCSENCYKLRYSIVTSERVVNMQTVFTLSMQSEYVTPDAK